MSEGLRIDAVARCVLARDSRELASLEQVGELRFSDGSFSSIEYETLTEIAPGEWSGSARCALGRSTARVDDRWLAQDGALHLERRVCVLAPGRSLGLHLRTAVQVLADPALVPRPFVPGNLYEAGQLPETGERSYSDGRVSYPLVGVYLDAQDSLITLLRADVATVDDGCIRGTREAEYLHDTDIGSVGISIMRAEPDRRVALLADFPYAEGEGTAFLDSTGSPARAYVPVPPAGTTIVLRYLFAELAASDYPRGVRAALELAIATQPPKTPQLPFTLAAAVELRRDSMAKTYIEWSDGGAGFILNFDPDDGYASAPRAFGASFTEHHMDRARDILEYGFTGRQLNVAHFLAAGGDQLWWQRRRRICDFFVREMVTDSGFCFAHYDLDARRPLYSVGDPGGPVLHYLAGAEAPGCYLRLISEAATDLLLNCQAAAAAGEDVDAWRDAIRRIAQFLIGAQQADGSWARAYTPDGVAITGGAWLGAGEAGASATAVPIPFLLAAADELPDLGPQLIGCAVHAARFVLDHQVRPSAFRGGTLDNPNVIDKESAFIAMAALVALHRRTGRVEYLDAAVAAASIGVSWTVLWDIPTVPGTRVHRAGVRSTGWGGINSIWGTGVTDIYSLFYLADLVYVAEQSGEPLFARVAELTAHGTAQMLAYSQERFEMADTGMQPEGIAHCGQGIDEDLIHKGDSWGGLGWMYTAGTYGLDAYLNDVTSTTQLTAQTALA